MLVSCGCMYPLTCAMHPVDGARSKKCVWPAGGTTVRHSVSCSWPGASSSQSHRILSSGYRFHSCCLCSYAGNITSRLPHRLLWIAFALHRLHIHYRKVRLGSLSPAAPSLERHVAWGASVLGMLVPRGLGDTGRHGALCPLEMHTWSLQVGVKVG